MYELENLKVMSSKMSVTVRAKFLILFLTRENTENDVVCCGKVVN